jgi:hypothetical protein
MRYLFVLLLACALGVGCQSLETFDDGKRWGDAERIDNRPRLALRAQIAIDAVGNAIAVWDQTDPSTARANDSDDIWFNFRDTGGKWGEAELIESREPDDSLEAQIAVDGEGNALVVFRQSEGHDDDPQQGHYRIWAVRHTPSGGWGDSKCINSDADDPECIESTVAGDASQPQIAVNPRGDAVVVWQQGDAGDESVSIWANRFTVGSGWGEAGPVETDAKILLTPQVAIDDDGNAIAVWERFDGVRSSIWSKRQTPTGEWLELQNVETDDSGNAFLPQVAADAEGNAIAVWQQQTDGTRFDIWSNLYLASTRKWDAEVRIGTQDAGDAEKPQVAMDRDGNAIAVWAQSGGDRVGIWSNRYVDGAGWGDATPVGPIGLGSARLPQVSTDPNGSAVAVWVQFDEVQDRVWSNRRSASGGWGESDPIDNDDEFRATGPQVAVDSEGNAVAVWLERNAFSFEVWSNRLE